MEDSTALEMTICLPIQERVTPLQNRAPGDPGVAEQFELPKYAYFFVLKELEGGEWFLWKKEEHVLEASGWQRRRLRANDPTSDSIYVYNERIRFILMGTDQIGHVYGICSNKKLEFSQEMENMSSMEDVLNWKFNTAPDSIQENLANIYSTPYNYNKNGNYYCAFDCTKGHLAHIDLMMYHVASKVDIKWNVEDSVRIDKTDRTKSVRLTYMDAVNLYNGMAYCFKPMENVVSANLSSGHTIHMLNNDEGLWWEGRNYFYTIPYTVSNSSTPGSYYPLQMVLQTNNSGDDYKPTIQLGIDATSPFVPWLRANFNLSKPLDAGEETKTAGS